MQKKLMENQTTNHNNMIRCYFMLTLCKLKVFEQYDVHLNETRKFNIYDLYTVVRHLSEKHTICFSSGFHIKVVCNESPCGTKNPNKQQQQKNILGKGKTTFSAMVIGS